MKILFSIYYFLHIFEKNSARIKMIDNEILHYTKNNFVTTISFCRGGSFSDNPVMGPEVCHFPAENTGKPPARCSLLGLVCRRSGSAGLLWQGQPYRVLEPKFEPTERRGALRDHQNQSMEFRRCLVSQKSRPYRVSQLRRSRLGLFLDGR